MTTCEGEKSAVALLAFGSSEEKERTSVMA